VTGATLPRSGADALLAAAVAGDEQAFRRLTDPHRRSLHLHCYRMLGSLDDADDALQETLLRAWRGLRRYEPRSPVAAWLQAIATNVCLTGISRRRRRREIPVDVAWSSDLLHLQPYPDRLLDELEGPEAAAELREGVELAFVAALQLLPPRQRAVLILRDVLGWSAKETAQTLDASTASVNSALQRARATLAGARDAAGRPHTTAAARRERELLGRFMRAWESVDIDGLVALLAEDALMTMPPVPMAVHGAEAIGRFFATVPAGGRLDEIRLVPTAANGQPALAAYMLDAESGEHRGYGIMVLALDGEWIHGIVGFADMTLLGRFGLPTTLEGAPVKRARS
jgi:RNA polymerase sigma-70 factor (ECF subfamily)